MPDQWISTREAAQLLGVSQRSVQNWVDEGKLRASLTAGGHRRLDPKEVESFLLNITTPSSVAPPKVISSHQDNEENVLRVLIVEDEPLILRLYALRFAEFSIPHRLFQAETPLQALFMAGRHLPHLIFTDLHMPQIDGLAMIHELIRRPEMQQTKFIVVTGLEAREIIKMGTLPEGVVVLPKPIPFNTVETILYQQAQALNIPYQHTTISK